MNEYEEHNAKLAIAKMVDSGIHVSIEKLIEKDLGLAMLNAKTSTERDDLSHEHNLLNKFTSRLIELANSVRGMKNG